MRAIAGFSMIELVVTIALTGVLTVGLANLLQHPMNGYADVSRRAELVALGDLAAGRVTRDLQAALPNSIRISAGGDALEFFLTRGGGRYRAEPGINPPTGAFDGDHSGDTDWLSFGGDTRFNLLGRFQNPGFSYGTALPAGTRLAIYPTDTSVWSEAASGSNPGTITPGATTITVTDDGDEDQIQLSASHTFRLESPSARLYLVEAPVTYVCDPAAGTLTRIAGYNPSAAQPTNLAAAPLSGGATARAADRIERCAFSYVPGTASRAGLVTLEIVLAAEDERIRLLQQVQVQNAP